MSDTPDTAFERFLIEDVILTLGTLRATLGWIAEGGAGAAGLDRLDRQIRVLEDRARRVHAGLGTASPPAPEPPRDCNVFTFVAPAAPAAPMAPLFRSRRA